MRPSAAVVTLPGVGRYSVNPLQLVGGRKTIENPLLNRLGAQAARAATAHGLYQLRDHQVPSHLQSTVDAVRNDGCVVLPNFVPEETFRQLREEVDRFLRNEPVSTKHVHGPTLVEHFDLSTVANTEFPILSAFVSDGDLMSILSAAERRRLIPEAGLRVVERVTQGGGADHGVDQETELHSDIFHATHKAWLYLEDVTLDRAPLVFVKGSQRMDMKRLSFEYKESVGANQQSRRISEEEVLSRGLRETIMEVPANTLVVANTCGYHRRLAGKPGNTRLAIQFSFRSNPFWPFTELPRPPAPGATIFQKGRATVAALPGVHSLSTKVRLLKKFRTLRPEKLRMAGSENSIYVDSSDPRAVALLLNDAGGQPTLKQLWVSAIGALSPNLVLDVGANYGEFSFLSSYPVGTKVLCIEANRRLLGLLERSRGDHPNKNQIELVNALVGERSQGDQDFYVDLSWSGRASAVKDNCKGPTQLQRIPTLSLDDISSSRGLDCSKMVFKIDVEGFEMQVVNGMKRLLSESLESVGIIEFSPQALRKAGTDPVDLLSALQKTHELWACSHAGRLTLLEAHKLPMVASGPSMDIVAVGGNKAQAWVRDTSHSFV